MLYHVSISLPITLTYVSLPRGKEMQKQTPTYTLKKGGANRKQLTFSIPPLLHPDLSFFTWPKEELDVIHILAPSLMKQYCLHTSFLH